MTARVQRLRGHRTARQCQQRRDRRGAGQEWRGDVEADRAVTGGGGLASGECQYVCDSIFTGDAGAGGVEGLVAELPLGLFIWSGSVDSGFLKFIV